MHLHSASSLLNRGAEVTYLTHQDLIDLHTGVSLEFSGTQAHPGQIASEFGLNSAIERPKATIFGKDAYPKFYEKAAAFFFALLQNLPFESNNQRAAVAALISFCDMNEREIDMKVLDEKTMEHLVKRATTYREKDVPAETVFSEIRQIFSAAIKPE